MTFYLVDWDLDADSDVGESAVELELQTRPSRDCRTRSVVDDLDVVDHLVDVVVVDRLRRPGVLEDVLLKLVRFLQAQFSKRGAGEVESLKKRGRKKMFEKFRFQFNFLSSKGLVLNNF